ncbi:MAG: SDR family oxidoreductase [Streptosporangiaceae bacterium]
MDDGEKKVMDGEEERDVHDGEKQVMDDGEERDMNGPGGTGRERRGGADMIVVTGATGNAGSEVVRALTARGGRVRAFVRDPGRARHVLGENVELAVGDFADPLSVRAALEGADALLLSCADDPRRVGWETAAIDAAVAAGVRRIVKLSAAAAEPGSPVAFWDWHGQVEQYLRSCGTGWVILRANWYMSNLLATASGVAAEGRLYAPAGQARIAMTDPRDVGAAAAAVLCSPGHGGSPGHGASAGHEGQTYLLTGPRAITYDEVAAGLSAATRSRVEFVDVPGDAAYQAMIGDGMPGFVAGQIVAMFAGLRKGAAAQVSPAVEALTGSAPRDFAGFARDHARLFAAAAAAARR